MHQLKPYVDLSTRPRGRTAPQSKNQQTADARKFSQYLRLVDASTASRLPVYPRMRNLEPELWPTDRILQRWAVGAGSDLPSEEWDDRRKSRPPPLDDASFTIVDQIIVRAPRVPAVVAWLWYKTPLPVDAIGRELDLKMRVQSRLNIVRYLWKGSLAYYRSGFAQSGHVDLVSSLSEVR